VKHFLVVGKGILGLSTAYLLSKNKHQVTLVHNPLKTEGSKAAAANLATKGQQYARDPHFHLKLQAKKNYSTWLLEIIQTARKVSLSDAQRILNYHFQEGLGIDSFESEIQCRKQWQRVIQSPPNPSLETFDPQFIAALDSKTISYQNEMWVDGPWLLKLLEEACVHQGVCFSQTPLTQLEEWEPFLASLPHPLRLILCPGAYSLELCETLQLAPSFPWPTPRHTLGSTWAWVPSLNLPKPQTPSSFWKIHTGSSLMEFVSATGEVVTWSGSEAFYFSSLSYKSNESNVSQMHYTKKHWEAFFEKFGPTLVAKLGFPERWWDHALKEGYLMQGRRIGFGHRELLATELFSTHSKSLFLKDFRPFLLSGAHKSGFLFAATLEKVFKEYLS
jgi:hypothetical protein